jgi:hypothetical protein
MKTDKELMIEYLKSKKIYGSGLYTPEIKKIKKIKKIELKEYDDEYGSRNQHYIVTMSVEKLNPSLGFVLVEDTCLVEKKYYEFWLNEKNSIILLKQNENE